MVLPQVVVSHREACIPRDDVHQVCELVAVFALHILEEIFKLLQAGHFTFNALVLLCQSFEL